MTDSTLPCETRQAIPICFRPSIVLDAVCFLNVAYLVKHGSDFIKYMDTRQLEEVKQLSDRLPDDFFQVCFNMSEFCPIILKSVTDNLYDMSLTDLIKLFESDATLKYITKDIAERYALKLKMLQSIGFEDRYQSCIMPFVKEQVEKNSSYISEFNTDDLFTRISVLKSSEIIDQVNIYMSFFSNPISFQLSQNSFLSSFNYGNMDYFALIAHELMHGIANEELTQMYLDYTSSNDYLKEMHRRLTVYWNEGDEEEFVLAAEYYLCLLSGRYSREELIVRAKQRYGGCCPVSVMLFDLLSQEIEPPHHYKKWLKTQFSSHVLPKENIIDCLKSM